ncbi:NUDIX domain-containing protein [Paucibacter sp. PLA-PC-4]|uniref:NUDIX hydrolase n=1 Tax=Paucibacter sp. PLA-PC-4 TaxID=2993655 RepID=UPI00224B56F5|nr:NUDIX domain-containing protein [Paucibacter sp. PLA-PC-4]MCX2864464.1 NUDIX domain-containing protein [Paucibacter sp. PLA-PC-4]
MDTMPDEVTLVPTLAYPVSIKAVLRAPSGELVLMLNERDEWELPGGRIEPGESPRECLAREIEEELGLRVEVEASPLDAYLFEVIPGKQVFVCTYRVWLSAGESFAPRLSHEHLQIGLFAPEALPANLPAGYRTSVRNALVAEEAGGDE